ncbi:hypothetical protein [Rhodopseudomonas palustris]|uniref:hypothetical protein n=1 Tax=Rhodopseudomonas palustris TaxID=1076 RepID=UPI000641C090|nr:hypothetical protein [Rhodopseudomonas palustris]
MMCIGRKLIGARSLLALEFLTVTDAFTRDITEIVDQPPPLAVHVRGEVKEWHPDYMIAQNNGRRDLVIVRTAEWLTTRQGPDRAMWKRDYVDGMKIAARDSGYGFRFVTEEQVYVQPRLMNAKLLRRHLVPYRSDNDEAIAISRLGELPAGSSVPELQKLLGSGLDAFVIALRLDWLGHLRLDRRTPFSRNSPFLKT